MVMSYIDTVDLVNNLVYLHGIEMCLVIGVMVHLTHTANY